MTDPTAAVVPDPFEVMPRNLSAYRQGNTGIDYVHRFESGKPGPHVLINALTHGNEFCGMVALCDLLDRGVRPLCGTLTLSFANVAAYESFDVAAPFQSRQLVHNMNRIWSAQWLDGPEDSPELRRARALRPAVAQADHLLDIHSTSQDVEPFWVYPGNARNGDAALAIGWPRTHMVMPAGLGSGTPLVQHGHFADPGARGVGAVVECGQHFKRATSVTAIAATRGFLAHFGLLEPDPQAPPAGPQRRLELLLTWVIKTPQFSFVRPLVGFEAFAKGELIATDGADEIRAPCDACTVLMPARTVIVGREGLYLTRPMQ